MKKFRQIRSKEQLTDIADQMERIGKAFFASIEIKSVPINVLIAIPRIIFGALLISDLYRRKIGMPVNETSGYARQLMAIPGWPDWIDQDIILWIDIAEKIAQGSIFALGFNTRLAAFAMIWTSLDQWIKGLMSEPFFIPLYLLFLIACLYSLILGSGKFGIDFWISRKLGSRIKKKKA